MTGLHKTSVSSGASGLALDEAVSRHMQQFLQKSRLNHSHQIYQRYEAVLQRFGMFCQTSDQFSINKNHFKHNDIVSTQCGDVVRLLSHEFNDAVKKHGYFTTEVMLEMSIRVMDELGEFSGSPNKNSEGILVNDTSTLHIENEVALPSSAEIRSARTAIGAPESLRRSLIESIQPESNIHVDLTSLNFLKIDRALTHFVSLQKNLSSKQKKRRSDRRLQIIDDFKTFCNAQGWRIVGIQKDPEETFISRCSCQDVPKLMENFHKVTSTSPKSIQTQAPVVMDKLMRFLEAYNWKIRNPLAEFTGNNEPESDKPRPQKPTTPSSIHLKRTLVSPSASTNTPKSQTDEQFSPNPLATKDDPELPTESSPREYLIKEFFRCSIGWCEEEFSSKEDLEQHSLNHGGYEDDSDKNVHLSDDLELQLDVNPLVQHSREQQNEVDNSSSFILLTGEPDPQNADTYISIAFQDPEILKNRWSPVIDNVRRQFRQNNDTNAIVSAQIEMFG